MRHISERLAAVSGVMVLSFLSWSCVNEEYDLTKPIDTTVDISGDLKVPVGSTEFTSIGKFITVEEDGVIVKDEDGNYSLELVAMSEPQSVTHELPEIGFESFAFEKTTLHIAYEDYLPGGSVPPGYDFDVELSGSSMVMDIEVNEELPKEVRDIRSAKMSTPFNIIMEISSGAVTLVPGLTISFPGFFTVEKSSSASAWDVQPDGHTVVLKESLRVASGSPVTAGLVLTSMDISELPKGQGVIDGFLVIGEQVSISGKLSVSTSDFSVAPEDLQFSISADMNAVSVSSAVVALNPENVTFTAEDQKIEIAAEDIPDFLKGEGTVLDLYNPVISLNVTNGTPFAFSVGARFASYKGDSQEPAAEAVLESSGLSIASGVSDYPVAISARGGIAGPGGKDVVIPEIADLISVIPDRILFSDITAVPSDGYAEVDLTKPLEFSFTYSAYAPLSFGEDFRLSYELPVKDLNKHFNTTSENGTKIGLEKAEIKFSLENQIPLALDLTVRPVDVDGNTMSAEYIEVTFDGSTGLSVKAGTPDSPIVSDVHITIVCHDSDALASFDGIVLNFTGSSGETVGQQLNENQGIRLRNISLSIKGGASLKL